MITATVYKRHGLYRGFEISGHAEYAPYGQDIVCAAVSLLATAVANALERQVNQAVAVSSADGIISCHLAEALGESEMVKAQAVLETLELGLKSVREQYPKHIHLQVVNVRHLS